MPEHLMHTKIPRFTLAQRGPLVGQSAQISLPGSFSMASSIAINFSCCF